MSTSIPEHDKDRLHLLRTGDEDAFAGLVEVHSERFFRAAYRILGNEEDARDAVQEAFLSAWRAIGRFSGKARVSTWLHRILINACLLILRRRRTKPERSLDDLTDGWASGDAGPDRDVERLETVRTVRDGIQKLPDTYREILQMREIDGVGTRDVARSLRVTPNAVKTRLYRAKQALRSELTPLASLAGAG